MPEESLVVCRVVEVAFALLAGLQNAFTAAELLAGILIGADDNLLEVHHLAWLNAFEVLHVWGRGEVWAVLAVDDHGLYPVAPVEVVAPECAAKNVGCGECVVERRVVDAVVAVVIGTETATHILFVSCTATVVASIKATVAAHCPHVQ